MARIRRAIFDRKIGHSRQWPLRWLRTVFLAVFSFVLMILPLIEQESIRPSLAGEQIERLQKPTIDRSDYNLKLGPVLVDLSSSLRLEFNDNVSLTEHNRQSDFIFRPCLNANVLWQLSSVNSLRLDLGIGYSKYFDHSQSVETGKCIVSRTALIRAGSRRARISAKS
jgi:hypothetical protein